MKWLIAPIMTAAMVTGLGLTLLTIVLRSPYTHPNLQPRPGPSYTRTEQILVGSPVPYTGIGLAAPVSSTANAVQRGQELFVTDGCATCHGLQGQGGPVGPVIVGSKVADLRTKTSKGPGGMPAFAQDALTDDQLTAIAAYLQSLAK